MLALILIVTLGAPDVGAIERAYAQWLDYQPVEHGRISEELAAVWAAPRMAGRDYSIMKPASGANVYLRFVQVDTPADYVPMKTFGWNAVEILVQDPDGLAEQLGNAKSPFRIVGVPRPLGPNSPIRAMQVVGPASEVLYLTRVPPEPGRHAAKTYVDRPFIIIVGGSDIDAMRNFYRDVFQIQVSPASQARMTVLNKAHGFDIETTHPLAMARLSEEYAIEIDGYPPSATVRTTRPGELAPAVASVTFEVDSVDALKVPLVAKARSIAAFPYRGRQVGVARGAAGELLEFIGRQ